MRDVLWSVLSPLLWWVIILVLMTGMTTSALLAESIKKSGEHWRASLSAEALYNTNVVQDPDDGPELIRNQGAAGFHWTGAAAYAHHLTKRFSLRLDYNVDMTVYVDRGTYDLTAQMFGLKPKYLLSNHAFVDFQYFFIHTLIGYEGFSGFNYFSPSYTRISGKWGLTRIHYYFSDNNYFENQARDAEEHGGGITQVFFFNNRTRSVGVGFQVSDEDSAGRFDRRLYDVKVVGTTPLLGRMQGQGEYRYSFRNYDTFASSTTGKTREDDQHRIRLQLVKGLSAKWGVLKNLNTRFTWDFTKNLSNLNSREYTSNRLGANISGEF